MKSTATYFLLFSFMQILNVGISEYIIYGSLLHRQRAPGLLRLKGGGDIKPGLPTGKAVFKVSYPQTSFGEQGKSNNGLHPKASGHQCPSASRKTTFTYPYLYIYIHMGKSLCNFMIGFANPAQISAQPLFLAGVTLLPS
jgi:hypothetical protein